MLKKLLPYCRPASSLAALLALAVGLGGCAKQEPGAEFNDPYEAQNRKVHSLNIALDRAVFGGDKPRKRPIMPKPIAEGFIHFADNLGMPSTILNNLLQGRLDPAIRNSARFVMNTTAGIGGIFDPATAVGLYEEDADFGQTLHVWGAPEGPFLVLPVAGPTTGRDLVGSIVDVVIDPMNSVLQEPETYYETAAFAASKVGERSVYSDLIEDILYHSADSYAQMRLLYLQYRHNALGIEAEVIDPYEDPYGQ